jgi:hypothetical protein
VPIVNGDLVVAFHVEGYPIRYAHNRCIADLSTLARKAAAKKTVMYERRKGDRRKGDRRKGERREK